MHCDTPQTPTAYRLENQVGPLETALYYAEQFSWYVVPTWTVMDDGTCECGSSECTHPGKHPRTDNGSLDATTDPDVIRSWYARWTRAGVGVELERSNLVDIAPDSETWLATFQGPGYGLPRTPSFASGGGAGHEHHLYRRPEACPARRICMTGKYDIMSAGIAVLPPSRGRYWLVRPDQAPLAMVPLWAVDRLRAAQEKREQARETARQAAIDADGEPPVRLSGDALARYRGELVKMGGQGPGGVNRSDSLFIIALCLARANATYRTILEAVRDRDTALGWGKYSARSDAEERYAEIAAKALTEVLSPDLQIEGVGNWPEHQAEPGPANGSCSPHCDRHLEEIARLKQVEHQFHELQKQNALRAALFRRPKKELTPADKLVGLAILNMQASRESRGQTGKFRVVMDAAEPDPEREHWSDNSLVATVGMSDSTIRRSLDRLAPIQGGGLWEREYEPFTTEKGIPSRRLYLVPAEDRPAPDLWKTIVSYVPPEEPVKPKTTAAEDIRCKRHPMAKIDDRHTWRCQKCGRDCRPPIHEVIDPGDYIPPVLTDPLVTGDVEPGHAPGRNLWTDFPDLQFEGLGEEPKTVTNVLNPLQFEGLGEEEPPVKPSGVHACHDCGAFSDTVWGGPVVQVGDVWLHSWPNAPCRIRVAVVS